MLLQLLRYTVGSGELYRDQHPKAKTLPPIYPLVLYHGQAQWRAPAALTRALAQVVAEAGYRVHLLAHQRFAPEFDGAANEHLHLFENTGDFRLEPLRELAHGLRDTHRPVGALIPFNNALGTGYENVIQVARAAVGDWIIGVTMDGIMRPL